MDYKLYVLRLSPPTGKGAIHDLDIVSHLASRPAPSLHMVRSEIDSRAQWDEALDGMIAEASASRLNILFVQGHGMRRKRGAGREPFNLLFTRQTDEHDIFETAIDLDASIGRIGATGEGMWFIVVDACGVSVRTQLDAVPAAARIAVLTATTPNGTAEAGEQGGLLSQHFLAALASGLQHGRSIRQISEKAREGVIHDTNRRQVPALKEVTDSAFLELPLPPERAAAGLSSEQGDVVGLLLEASLTGRLTGSDLGTLAAVARNVSTVDAVGIRLVVLASELIQTREVATLKALEKEVMRCQVDEVPVNQHALARAQHAIGWGYLVGLGEGIWAAADHLELALGHLAVHPLPELEGQVHDTLATALIQNGAWQKAFEHYRASRALKEDLHDRRGLEMTRQNLGWALLAAGRFDEGEAEFRAGVEACLARLGTPPPKAHLAEMTSTLESLVFHAHGLHTALLIRGASSSAHSRFGVEFGAWWPFARHLISWGSAAPVIATENAEKIGRGGLLALRGSRLPEGSTEEAQAWQLAAEFVTEGTASSREALTQCLTALIDSKASRSIAIALGIASHLYHAPRLRTRTTEVLLQRCVKKIQDESGHQLAVEGYPWYMGKEGFKVDTDAWLDHLFLGPQRALSMTPPVVAHPSVTEQYIQLLAWYSALVLFAARRVEAPLAWSQLRSAPNKPFMLTLRSSTAMARQAAKAPGHAPKAEWSKELETMWLELSPFADYESLESFYTERNTTTHRVPMREERLREILEKHQRLISQLSAPFSDLLETPTVIGGQRSLDKGGLLEAVQLKIGVLPTFDCGLLLAREAGHATRLCVPHRIDLPSGASDTVDAEFLVYDTHAPQQEPRSLRVQLELTRYPPLGRA